ncbi:hypothetical protein GPN2_13587 [Streptomyces murinus]
MSTRVAPSRRTVRCSVPPMGLSPRFGENENRLQETAGHFKSFLTLSQFLLFRGLPSCGGLCSADVRTDRRGQEERWSTTLPTCSSRWSTRCRTARRSCISTIPAPGRNAG